MMISTGAMILAGGKGRRMGGCCKALLPLGNVTFLGKLAAELKGFKELLISADRSDRYWEYGLPVVPDLYLCIGPIGGLYSGLSVCRSDALLVVSCDTPLFSAELADYLISYLSEEWDALVLEDRTGRLYPLCSIYRKTSLPVLQQQIEAGRYRITDLLSQLRVKRVQLKHSIFPDTLLQNVNRPADYERLLQTRKPVVVAISGVKNSGKTTLITRLIPMLQQMGHRLAVIKHDGHDFSPDVPETDSYRYQEAGAAGAAVFSSSRYLVVKNERDVPLDILLSSFADMDLILLEGFKASSYPKIEVVRSAVSQHPVCHPETLLAVLSDLPLALKGIPVFPIDAVGQAAALINQYTKGESKHA